MLPPTIKTKLSLATRAKNELQTQMTKLKGREATGEQVRGIFYTLRVWSKRVKLWRLSRGRIGGHPAAMSAVMTAPRMVVRIAGGYACQHY